MIEISYDNEQLLKKLNRLDAGLQAKGIARSLTPAVRPITQAMKAIVRSELFDSGALFSSIGRSSLSKSAKSRLSINQDTVAIVIGPKKSKVDGQQVSQYTKAVVHEFGSPAINVDATGFMQRALEIGEPGMQSRFFAGMQQYINRISQ